jgi:hypothetical protein
MVSLVPTTRLLYLDQNDLSGFSLSAGRRADVLCLRDALR